MYRWALELRAGSPVMLYALIGDVLAEQAAAFLAIDPALLDAKYPVPEVDVGRATPGYRGSVNAAALLPALLPTPGRLDADLRLLGLHGRTRPAGHLCGTTLHDLCDEHSARLTAPRGWDVVRLDPDPASLEPSLDALQALADAVRSAARPAGEPAPPRPRRYPVRSPSAAKATSGFCVPSNNLAVMSQTEAGFPADLVSAVIKAYDVRGLVGEQITSDFVQAVGAAFVEALDLREAGSVVIGHDMRDSSPRFADAFAKGVTEHGVDVVADRAVFHRWAVLRLGTPGHARCDVHRESQSRGVQRHQLCRAGGLSGRPGQWTGRHCGHGRAGVPGYDGPSGSITKREMLEEYADIC